MAYYTYILRCADDSLYTGITTDLPRRFAQHSGGRGKAGAKYTSARQPLKYECAFLSENRSTASKLESRIKALPRSAKLLLIAGEDVLDLEGYQRVDADNLQ